MLSPANRDLYIKNSSYFRFDKVTTLVLIQYGEKDATLAWMYKEAFVAFAPLEQNGDPSR